MKILLIGSKKSKESQLLKKEAEKRKHQLEIVSLARLILKIDKNLSLLTSYNIDIDEFKAVLFRAINRHITEAKVIAKYMKGKNKIVIDEILAKGDYDYHKFLMHAKLAEKRIPQPATYFPLSFNALKKILGPDQGQPFGSSQRAALDPLKPPFIVKHIKEMHGRKVFRFDQQKKVLEFFTPHLSKVPQTSKDENIKLLKGAGFAQNKKERLGLPRGKAGRYLIQEWYPAKKYYRVLVLGNRALGAIERLSLLAENQPKLPLAQRSQKAELTPALKNISLTAVQALNLEFAGLDIMPDKEGKLRILEINRSPQFKRFSQVTGLNVAEEVIKYIERKSQNFIP